MTIEENDLRLFSASEIQTFRDSALESLRDVMKSVADCDDANMPFQARRQIASLKKKIAAYERRLSELSKSPAIQSADKVTRITDGGQAATSVRDLIFISYSHTDEAPCMEFLKMVRPTAEKYGMKLWTDHEIPVGSIWREEIEKALKQTKIGVLLVSPDFLDSSFIQKNELPPLLEVARTQGARIFWIACRPCNVEDTETGKFQGVNRPSKPLSGLSQATREKELQRISQELFRLAQRVSAS